MRRTRFMLAAALIAAGALLVRAAGPTPPPPSSDDHLLRVGVVDVGKILRTMKETQKIQDDFHSQRDELNRQGEQRAQEINNLLKQRENVRPGSAQWEDDTHVIDQKKFEGELWKAMAQLKLERDYKKNLSQLYDHVTVAATQVAQEQHLDLVIADQHPEIGPDLDKVTPQQLEQALQSRAVLVANKKADITADVLMRVEANYSSSSPNKAVGVVAPSDGGIAAK